MGCLWVRVSRLAEATPTSSTRLALRSGRPNWLTGGQVFEGFPVGTWRCKRLDDDGAVPTGLNLVGHVRRHAPGAAGTKLADLVTHSKGERACDEQSSLFVLVAVLGNECVRSEFDDAERHVLPVDDTPKNPVPDLLRG